MEENNKKCECFLCRCGKHTWVKWAIALLILWAVFAVGVKIGEFKYMVRDGFRGGYYGMMGGYGDSYGCGKNDKGGFFPGMMNFWGSKIQNSTSTE